MGYHSWRAEGEALHILRQSCRAQVPVRWEEVSPEVLATVFRRLSKLEQLNLICGSFAVPNEHQVALAGLEDDYIDGLVCWQAEEELLFTLVRRHRDDPLALRLYSLDSITPEMVDVLADSLVPGVLGEVASGTRASGMTLDRIARRSHPTDPDRKAILTYVAINANTELSTLAFLSSKACARVSSDFAGVASSRLLWRLEEFFTGPLQDKQGYIPGLVRAVSSCQSGDAADALWEAYAMLDALDPDTRACALSFVPQMPSSSWETVLTAAHEACGTTRLPGQVQTARTIRQQFTNASAGHSRLSPSA